jgi:two-component system response regulator YesN
MELKMLIVDDEPVICQGLRLTIPWHELGVSVVGEAYNGRQALRLAKEHNVDLILTDVKMPEMDGLALAEALRREMPHVRIVMISGYDEFAYAQQALRLGVKDYLLKPVDIDELWQLVQKLVNERKNEVNVARRERKEALTRWVMSHILHLPVPFTVMEDDLISGFRGFWLCVSELDAYADIEQWLSEAEMDELKSRWQRFVEQVLDVAEGDPATEPESVPTELATGEIISFFSHPNCLVTVHLFVGTSTAWERGSGVQETLISRLERINSEWKGPSRLCFGVAAPFRDFSRLHEAYEQAKTALQHKVCDECRCVFSAENVYRTKQGNQTRHDPYFDLRELERQLVEAILQNDVETLTTTVESMFQCFRTQNYFLDEAFYVLQEIRYVIEHRLRDFLDEDTASVFLTGDIDLRRYNTYPLLKKLFLEDVLTLAQILQNGKRGKNHWLVERAKRYIEENFHKELRAFDVARAINITPNYFSALFKQELGKSFSEYLNELRVEKAKHLLTETSCRVFEIAEQVGYKDYKYFVHVFKKLTGVTPTSYRKYKISG